MKLYFGDNIFWKCNVKACQKKEAATCRKLVRRQLHILCHCNTIHLWLGQRDDLVKMVQTSTEHNVPNDSRLEQLSQRCLNHRVEWKS
ncbi:hypothetical protein MXB_3080 [Myxobolus squamalis]|nr:hypothetical protein MXB_3080 [Myxobolus squamalis]